MVRKEKSGVLNSEDLNLEELVNQVEIVDSGLTILEELQLEEKIRQEELEDRTGFEWIEEMEDY